MSNPRHKALHSDVQSPDEHESEDRDNLTLLFSWPMKKNIDMYVLLNDYETGDEEVRAAFVKLVYRF